MIVLNWVKNNPDSQFTNYKVYRSTNKTTVYDAGNLVTTITDKNVTSYQDTTALPNTLYYYGIELTTNSGSLKGPVQLSSYTNYPGAGNNSIIVGDFEFGLMDQLVNSPLEDMMLIKIREVYEYLKIAILTPAPILTGSLSLNKYMYKGEIIYAPTIYKYYSNATVTPKNIYNVYLANAIANPVVFQVDGQYYKLDIMTYEEMIALMVPTSIFSPMVAGPVRRVVRNAPIGIGNYYHKPTSSNMIYAGFNNSMAIAAPTVVYPATSTQGTVNTSFAWCLRPVSPP